MNDIDFLICIERDGIYIIASPKVFESKASRYD